MMSVEITVGNSALISLGGTGVSVASDMRVLIVSLPRNGNLPVAMR